MAEFSDQEIFDLLTQEAETTAAPSPSPVAAPAPSPVAAPAPTPVAAPAPAAPVDGSAYPQTPSTTYAPGNVAAPAPPPGQRTSLSDLYQNALQNELQNQRNENPAWPQELRTQVATAKVNNSMLAPLGLTDPAQLAGYMVEQKGDGYVTTYGPKGQVVDQKYNPLLSTAGATFQDFLKTVVGTGLALATGTIVSQIAPTIASTLDVSLQTAKVIAGAAVQATSQLATTGNIDPAQLALSAVSQVVAPEIGKKIADQVGESYKSLTGETLDPTTKAAVMNSAGSAVSTAIKGGESGQVLNNAVAGAVAAELKSIDPGLAKAVGTYISTGNLTSSVISGIARDLTGEAAGPTTGQKIEESFRTGVVGTLDDGTKISVDAEGTIRFQAPDGSQGKIGNVSDIPAGQDALKFSQDYLAEQKAAVGELTGAPAPSPAPAAAPTPAEAPAAAPAPSVVVSAPAISGTDQALLDLISQAPAPAPAPVAAPTPAPPPPIIGGAPAAEPAPATAPTPVVQVTGGAPTLTDSDLIALLDRDLAAGGDLTAVGSPPPPPAPSPAPPPPQEKTDFGEGGTQVVDITVPGLGDLTGVDLIDTSGVAAGDLGTSGAGVDTGAGNVTIGGGTTNVGDVSNAGQVTIAGTNVTDLTGADLIDLTTGGVDTGAVTDLGNVTITAGGGAAGDASNAGQVVVTGGGATNVSDQDLIDFTGLVDSGAISDLANTTITTGLGDNNASQVTITGTAANNVGSDLIDSDVGDGNIVSGGTGTVVISGAGDNNAASNVGNVIIDTTTTGNVTLGDGSTTNVSNVGNVSTDLFTYVPPKRRPPSVAELVTMRQYPTTGVTQGLAPRAPGEIESEVTGKKRRNVWNEASLRLKDALGL